MSDVKTETRLAKVVHVIDPDANYAPVEVVINRGKHQGIKLGDRFLVFGVGPTITDPDTGKNLGQLEIVRGRGEVVHVQDDLATIRTIERQQKRATKRVVREPGGFVVRYDRVVEEELPPETEKPFVGILLGDLAKPI